MYTLSTLYRIEKTEEKISMNFSGEIDDRKESEEGRINFQNKCVSSQKGRYRKEEGATAVASHLPSLTAG